MNLWRMVATRIALGIVTLLLVSAVIYLVVGVLPGDIAVEVLGRNSTAQARHLFDLRLHLNEPLWDRYAQWLGGFVRGHFGESITTGSPVRALVMPALGASARLSAYALVLYVPITLTMALIGAVWSGRGPDSVTSTLTLIGLSLPDFVIGTILIVMFAVVVHWFPAIAGTGAQGFWATLRAITLPAATLAAVMSAYSARMLRSSLIEVLQSQFIRTATLKGTSRWRVIFRHALPNAIVPTLNVTALNLTYLIGGVVVVEVVFSYPGLGQLLVNSIAIRDIPVVEAATLIASGIYIAANVFSDVVAVLVTPRLRYARPAR
ncbi:MAG: ABC transporter permease [Actinomycetota bacterium]|nr:ABC transporter permease [Actinomycetota bacterium]